MKIYLISSRVLLKINILAEFLLMLQYSIHVTKIFFYVKFQCHFKMQICHNNVPITIQFLNPEWVQLNSILFISIEKLKNLLIKHVYFEKKLSNSKHTNLHIHKQILLIFSSLKFIEEKTVFIHVIPTNFKKNLSYPV